jgi:hypothetical protein
MTFPAVNGETEEARHDSTEDTKHNKNDTVFQKPVPSSSSETPQDAGSHTPHEAASQLEIHDRVHSWLQADTTGNIRVRDFAYRQCRTKFKDEPCQCLASLSSEAASTTAVKPEPSMEAKDNGLKRFSSSAGSSQQTTESSKDALSFGSSIATTISPGGTPCRVGSLYSISENRSPSPRGISNLSRFTDNFTISKLAVPQSREFTYRRINPKKARLRNGGQNFNYLPLSRTPPSLGRPSSIALGKRPVGCYGIGEQGGFPRAVSSLAFAEPRSSTLDQEPFVPLRTDSKLQADSLPTSETSSPIFGASLLPQLEPCVLVDLSSKLRTDSWPTSEISSLAGEASPRSKIPDSTPCDLTEKKSTAKVVIASSPINALSSEPACYLPRANVCSKEGKRASLSTAFYATALAAFGCYGEALSIDGKFGNPLDHVVPLSDACPLLVGSLALRQKLCSAMYIDQEDPRVPRLLNQHGIELDKVSGSDQILLWHLAVYEKSMDLSYSTSPATFSHGIYWKKSDCKHSEVQLTLDDLISWLKCKQYAHDHSARLRTREFERLAANRSPYHRDRLMSHRKRYSQESGALSSTELLPNNPAAVWLNIYRLLRCRGISEGSLDREDFAHLMTLPRNSRRAYVDTLATKCHARSLDNASIDRRQAIWPIEERPILHTTRNTSYPEEEEEDKLAALPGTTHFKRPSRRRSSRSSEDWNTPLAQLPRTKAPKPLLSNITLPKGYVPPFRVREDDQPNRPVTVGESASGDRKDGPSKHPDRRVSQMSQFSASTTESEKMEKTRWGRFRKRVRKCLPPCCCG